MLEIVQIYDVSQNVKSLGLLEIIPDNRICGYIANTEVYGSPPSKCKFWKSVFFMLERVQLQALSPIFKALWLQMAEIIPDNRKLAHF